MSCFFAMLILLFNIFERISEEVSIFRQVKAAKGPRGGVAAPRRTRSSRRATPRWRKSGALDYQGCHDGFLYMQSILGLVPDHRMSPLDDRVRDLLAAVG